MHRRIRVLRQSFAERPTFDTAVSHALLRRAARGEVNESLRLNIPGRIVAFGRQDVKAGGYLQAVKAARAGGFEAVERLAGGRAAVFHPGTLAFSWTIPTDDPTRDIQPRFEEIADLVSSALRRLGIDARVGELPGEYCPGAFSVNSRGRKKLMGVGQRLVKGAAHIGGVIVVNDSRSIRHVLVPVYDALGLDWDPGTAGSIEDEAGAPRDIEKVAATLLAEFGSCYVLEDAWITDQTLALAEELTLGHASPEV